MVDVKWLRQVWGSGFPSFLPLLVLGGIWSIKDRGAHQKLTTSLGLDFRPNTFSPNYRYRRDITHSNGLGWKPWLLSDKFLTNLPWLFCGWAFWDRNLPRGTKWLLRGWVCFFTTIHWFADPRSSLIVVCFCCFIKNNDTYLDLPLWVPNWFLVYRHRMKSFVWSVRAY